MTVANFLEIDKRFNRLTLAELRSVDTRFSADALEVFDLDRSLSQRNLPGAPGTAEVKKQLARWCKRLA